MVQELKRDGQWSIVDLTGDGAADGSVHNAFLEPADTVGSLHFADTNLIYHAQRANGTAVPQQPVSEFIFLNTHHTATDLTEDPSLDVLLDTSHKPGKGWKVAAKPSGYVLTADDYPAPIHVGKPASYRYESRGLTTAGLGRTSYDGTPGHIKYDPADWNAEFNYWPELIFPTAYAESGADFSVINAWDLAGMTFGFIQLAAHTADDLIPLFRRLIDDLPEEAERFFPELILVGGKICYRKGGGYRRLEVRAPAPDPVPNDLVDRGLFVGFFNRDRQRLGNEEVQAAARWLAWTQESEAMRRIQVAASIDNMRDSLDILHRALLHGASAQYPKGVDGMRCDYLAAALAVPRLNPRRVDKAVWALCRPDILSAFKEIEYGLGNREKTVLEGVLKRGQRLAGMRYDFVKGHPV